MKPRVSPHSSVAGTHPRHTPSPHPKEEKLPDLEEQDPFGRFGPADGWERAASGWRRLLFGRGLGGFGRAMGMPQGFGVHNTYLDALNNTGVPGVLFFVGFWIMSLYRLARLSFRPPQASDSSPVPPLGVFLALLTLAVGQLFTSVQPDLLGTMIVSGPLWLAMTLRSVPRDPYSGGSDGAPGRRDAIAS